MEDAFELQKKNDSNFYLKIYSDIIKKAFSQYCQSAYVPPFTGRIKQVTRDLSYKLITFKTKETDLFQPLESTLIYMTQVSTLMEENQKVNVIGNGLAKNVYPALNRAHQIYKEFNDEKYFNYFTDEELQAEYYYFIKSNLYLTSILMDEFDQAQKMLDEIKPEQKPKENHHGSAKAILNHMKTRGRSEQQKAYDRMRRHELLVKRELTVWEDIQTRLQL